MPAGQPDAGRLAEAVSAWMSAKPWIRLALALLASPSARTADASSSGCGARPQPNVQTPKATEAAVRRERCRALTSLIRTRHAPERQAAYPPHTDRACALCRVSRKSSLCADVLLGKPSIERNCRHVGGPRQSKRPLASSTPSIKFRFCTAAPDAPLPKLSRDR